MDLNKIVPTEHEKSFADALVSIVDKDVDQSARLRALKDVSKVMQAFFRRPEKQKKERLEKLEQLRALSRSSIPQYDGGMESIFNETANSDGAWEKAFIDAARVPDRDYFEILDITSGVAFKKIPRGQKAEVAIIEGTEKKVYLSRYGAALQWELDDVMFRKINIIQQKAIQARDAYYAERDERYYTLLASSINSHTTSWDSGGANELEKDIATVAAALYAIADRLKDKYVKNPLSQKFLWYINPKIWGRAVRTLRQTTQDVPGQPARIPYNVELLPTFSEFLTNTAGGSTVTDSLIVLPGFKNQKSVGMELTSYMDFDNLTLANVESFWSFEGAYASDQQSQKLSFA